MPRTTVTTVDRAIKDTGLEIIKGHGYFYFMPRADVPLDREMPDVASLYTTILTGMELADVVEHVTDAVTEWELSLVTDEIITDDDFGDYSELEVADA